MLTVEECSLHFFLRSSIRKCTNLEYWKKATSSCIKSTKLNPKFPDSYNNLAWLLCTAKDPAYRDCRKAIFYARKALHIDRNAAWTDTLAAAYAECGEFKKAVRLETEAYKLSKPRNENFRNRIEIYKLGKTYSDWKGNVNFLPIQ